MQYVVATINVNGESLVPPGAPVSLAVMGNVITWLPSDIANSNTGTAAFYIVQYTLETLDWPVDSNMVSTMQPMVELTRYVMAGSRYRVRVRAGNHGGLSDWSDAVIVTPIDQPTTDAGYLYTCVSTQF